MTTVRPGGIGSTGSPPDGSVTNTTVASNAAITLDKTADSATRLALTAAERATLTGLTERIQDDAAVLFTGGTHSGVSFAYDDLNAKVNATVTGGSGSDTVARAIGQARLIAVDTFTRADGALGTAESGQAWEAQTGAFTIASGSATATAAAVATLDVGRADVDVSCVIVPQSGTAPSLVFRAGPTSADRLAIALDMANGFRLNKLDTNVLTALATTAQTFTAGQAYTVRAIAVGAQVTCYLDGALLLTYTLTSGEQTKFGAYTRVGLRQNASVAGVTFDGLSSSFPPAGGTNSVSSSLVDAKGDLLVGSADNTVARQAVGANGLALVADSTQANGVAWLGNSVYVMDPATYSDADLTTALGAAPASAQVVAVKVAGT